jgi:hypothetical protein
MSATTGIQTPLVQNRRLPAINESLVTTEQRVCF